MNLQSPTITIYSGALQATKSETMCVSVVLLLVITNNNMPFFIMTDCSKICPFSRGQQDFSIVRFFQRGEGLKEFSNSKIMPPSKLEQAPLSSQKVVDAGCRVEVVVMDASVLCAAVR